MDRTATGASVPDTSASGANAPLRPLLFLDVDGVLNCYRDGYDFHDLGGIHVYVPPGTRERVTRLLEHFDPVWATAWLGRAHTAWRNLLGLTMLPWPYLDWVEYKLPHLLRFAGERPWAFVDDDAEWELRKLGWTREHVTGLILSPDTEVGLTDAHVDELIAWASGPEAGSQTEPEAKSVDQSMPCEGGGLKDG